MSAIDAAVAVAIEETPPAIIQEIAETPAIVTTVLCAETFGRIAKKLSTGTSRVLHIDASGKRAEQLDKNGEMPTFIHDGHDAVVAITNNGAPAAFHETRKLGIRTPLAEDGSFTVTWLAIQKGNGPVKPINGHSVELVSGEMAKITEKLAL